MTIATLGRFPLLGSSEISWSLRPGVKPVFSTFDMVPDHANALFNTTAMQKKSTELTLKNEVSGKTESFKNLWVLRLAPGENKNIMRVVVADRRWMWSNSFIARGYNMRRHVGVKNANASDQPAVNPMVPKYAYQKWSLKDLGDPPASKWTPEDVIKDVFNEVGQIERMHAGQTFSVTISPSIGSQLKSLPVEDLWIKDQGDMAIQRVLSYFPEADVVLNAQGDVLVYSRVDGSDAKIVQMLGPEIVGRGHFEFINQAAMRPSSWHVYFQIESELRFDFIENASARGSTVVENDDTLRIDNVLSQPDYQLPLTGGANASAQGTWLTMDQAFNLWGNMPDPFGQGGFQLDHSLVQKAFMPFNDLWAKMGLIGSLSPDADWGQRIAAVHGHYRTSFRFNSRIMDRILSWKDYRVATVDRTSGQRAPAMAWGDYSVINNVRSCFQRRGQAHAYAFNKSGYPASGILDSGATPSPARVKMVDHDQGIVHVEYYDPFGIYMTFLPSKITESTMPNGDITKKGTSWVLFDSVGAEGQELPSLSPSFKLAMMVTAQPASPNNLNRFFKIEVKPDDVTDIVPGGARTVANCLGPPMRVHIGPGIETARVQWLDSRKNDILKIFGIGGGGEPNLAGLVINEGDRKDGGVGGGGAVSLWALAKAEAARGWAVYADRYLGAGTGTFTPGIVPTGYTEKITHSVGTKGDITTRAELKEKPEMFSLDALLSSSARAVLNRQVML